MAAADYNSVVQDLYVAYFGRPADPVGLANFTAQLNALGAPTDITGLNAAYSTNATIKALVDQFGTSAESAALYTGGTVSFVNAIYQNVLNRSADLSGLLFWSQAIDSGALSKGKAALAIMQGALSNTSTQGLVDAQVVTNKIAVAANFTAALDTADKVIAYSGNSAAAAARSLLSAVTSTTDTTAYQTNVTSTVTTLVNTPIPGTTYSLTTASDILTGTSGNDAFNATLTSSSQSLNPGDVLDGQGGTSDSLNVTSTITGNGSTTTIAGVTLSNIETVAVQNLGSNGTAGQFNTVSVDATNFTGVSTVQDNYSTGGVTFTNLKNIVNVSATGNGTATGTAATLNIGYQAAAVAGTNDSATISLNNNGSAATANNFLDITENGIENLTFNSTGTKSYAKITDSSLSKITVTGSADLDLSAGTSFGGSSNDGSASTKVVKVDASAFTGGLTVDVSGVGGTYVSLTGGSGNDSITVQNIDKNSTIAGGAGTDTLVIKGNITNSSGTTDAFTNVSGFEKVKLGSQLATTLDTTSLGGITDVTLTDYNGGTLDKAASGFTVRTTDAAAAGNLTVNINNALSGTADSINVVLNDTTSTTSRNYQTITTSYVESAAITSQGKTANAITNTLTFNDVGLTKLTVTGNEGLALTLAGMNTVTSIDASAATGSLAMANNTGLAATGATIKGGSVADTIYGSAGNDSISAGDGNDTITMGSNLTNGDTIDGGAGTADVLTATINGTTATTGKFNISNVETVSLSIGGASTVDSTNITGATLAINGGNTLSVTNLGANSTVALGDGAGTAYSSTATLALANATGTADVLNLKLNTTAAQTATIKTDGIETINVSATTGVTVGGTQTLSFTTGTGGTGASTITLTGTNTTLNGQIVDLGTMLTATTTVDASGDTDASGTFKVVASSVSTTIKGSAGANSITGGAGNDTITISTGFDGSDTVAGGAGTDTLNATISATNNNLSLANVSAVEAINLTVGTNAASVKVTTAGGLNDANLKTITVAGTNPLSTFTSTAAIGSGTAFTGFDASSLTGQADVAFDKNVFATSTNVIKGGAATNDIARVSTANSNVNGKGTMSGFEQLEVAAIGGAGTLDMTNVSGLSRVIAVTDNTARSLTLSKLAAGVIVDVGNGTSDINSTNSLGSNSGAVKVASTVIASLSSTTGSTDALTINVNNVSAAGALTLTADGVETLTVNNNDSSHANTLTINDTNTNAVSLVLGGTGTGTQTLSLASSITSLDASGSASAISMTSGGRTSSAMTITGSSLADTIVMNHGNDVLNGGGGSDTLKIAYNGTVGGFVVDLSSTTDQITTFNGGINAAVQKGFVNVDLSGITGSFGSDITANSAGSTITGTSNNDNITLGAGSDTVKLAASGAANGSDTINSFTTGAGKDVLNVSAFITTPGSLTALTTTGDVTATTNKIFTVDMAIAISSKVYTGADFADIFTASGASPLDSVVAGAVKDVLVVQGTDVTKVFYIDSSLDGTATNITASDVKLVATLVGVTDASTALVIGNFA